MLKRMRGLSSAWRAALLGAAAAALTTLPGLGAGTLWDNSETAYGEVAREIVLSGNAVVMHLNAAPWFVQPPLYFWVAAFLAKLLGMGAFALRLPSALATIAMGAAVSLCAERMAGLRAAAIAGVILATALMQTVLGRLAIMDALLDLAVTLGILGAFGALRTGSERLWCAAWLACGLGILAKGPVALVIPVLVVGVWALWERNTWAVVHAPSSRAWLLGIALCALIVVPWLLLSAQAAGSVALSELLGHYTVGRYLGTIENQSGPVWYYVPVVILGFFPWSAFLLPAIWWAWKQVAFPERSLERLCLVWAVLPFVFFSFAQTKLPNYVALELPALALLSALWFDDRLRAGEHRKILPWAAFVPLTLVAMGSAIVLFAHNNRLDMSLGVLLSSLAAIGAVMFIGSSACWGLLWEKRLASFSPFALAAASLCAMTIIALIAEPLVEQFKPIPTLAARIQSERGNGDTVAIWGVAGANALVFSTKPPVVEITPPFEERKVRETICSAKRLFLVTSRKRAASLAAYHRTRKAMAIMGSDTLLLYEGPHC